MCTTGLIFVTGALPNEPLAVQQRPTPWAPAASQKRSQCPAHGSERAVTLTACQHVAASCESSTGQLLSTMEGSQLSWEMVRKQSKGHGMTCRDSKIHAAPVFPRLPAHKRDQPECSVRRSSEEPTEGSQNGQAGGQP